MPDITLDSLQSGGSYPQWATEESLQKLLMLTKDTPSYHRFMQKFAAKMSRGGGDIADVMKTAADEMKQWSREVVKASRDKDKSGFSSSKLAADGATRLGSAADSAASRLGAMAKSATRTDTSMAGAFGNITDMLKMMVRVISGGGALGVKAKEGIGRLKGSIDPAGGKDPSKWGTILGGLGDMAEGAVAAMAAGLGVAMTLIDDFGQSLRKTGDLGVSFGESFMQLRVQLADAGLGLDNLEKQLALNSTAFALMGDNVQAGIRVWIDWRKRFVKDGDMEFFTNLGFAMEELNDYFLKDTRNRILAGRDREQATEEATESLRELARNTKAVSELTGESRKKLMQAVIERESDAKWQAYLGTLPVEEQKQMESSLRNMVTLYGLSEKQQKAVQDAIRMGGNVSLLAENIFGDAFADWKFMPKALNEMQGTIKQVASGEVIDDAQFRRMALTYHDAIMEFWETPQGKMLAQVGGSIIDFAAGFAARQQAMLYTQNREGFLAERTNLNESISIKDSLDEVSNMTILSGQQIGAIMQNIFAKGVTDEMRGLIEDRLGNLVKKRQAYMQGDITKKEYDEVVTSFEKLFEKGGELAGWVSATMGSMAVGTAEIVIAGSVGVINFAKSLNADVARDFLSNIFGLSGDHLSESNQSDRWPASDDDRYTSPMAGGSKGQLLLEEILLLDKKIETFSGKAGSEERIEKWKADIEKLINERVKHIDASQNLGFNDIEASRKKLMAETQEEISKHGQTLKAAEKSGLYDKDWAGASEINKEALQQGVQSGMIQKEMLNAIIDDKDLRDEDLKFMKKLVEQATTGESLHVRDKGIHDRLDMIVGKDFRLNANRLGFNDNGIEASRKKLMAEVNNFSEVIKPGLGFNVNVNGIEASRKKLMAEVNNFSEVIEPGLGFNVNGIEASRKKLIADVNNFSEVIEPGLGFNVNGIEASRKKLMAEVNNFSEVIEPGSQYEFAKVDHNARMRALTGETMAEDFGQMLHVWTSTSRSLDEKMEQQVANNTATVNEVSKLVQAGHGTGPDFNREFQNRLLATMSSVDKKLGPDGPISDAVRNSKAYT